MPAPPFYLQNPYLQQQGFFNSQPLSLGDLYEAPDPSDQPDFPDMPAPVSGMSGLSPEARAEIRRRAILQAALAIAAPGGRMGTALAGAAQSSLDYQQTAIDAQNKQSQEQYQFARQRYADEAMRAKEKAAQDAEEQTAKARLATYQQIVTSDPELSTQAEGAARSGDDKRLQALLQAIPDRAYERSQGYDPNDPFVKNRVEASITTDAEAARRASFLHTLPEELGLRNNATFAELTRELPVRRANAIAQAVGEKSALNNAGLLWEPPSLRARNFEPQIRQIGDRMMMLDLNQLDPATGQPKMTDIGPASARRQQQFRDANGGIWLRDMITGEAKRDPNFDSFGAPVGQAPPPQKSFWDRLTGSSSPPPAPPKASGASVPGTRPAPAIIDQPTGAPARGRGQGPAPVQGMGSLKRSPLSPRVTPEQQAQQVEAKTGPLPPAARAQLLTRLKNGSDPQTEIGHILEAQGAGPGGGG